MEALIILLIILTSFLVGNLQEVRHYRRLQNREMATRHILVSTDEDEVAEYDVLGLASGSSVVSVDYFKRFVAAMFDKLGGRVSTYETLIDRARRQAIQKLKEKHPDADAILNLRLIAPSIGSATLKKKGVSAIEFIAYGTAIRYRNEEDRRAHQEYVSTRNVNISERHPVLDAMRLLGIMIGIGFIVYLALGIVIDKGVDHLPTDFEAKAFAKFNPPMKPVEDHPLQGRVDTVLEKLTPHVPVSFYDYKVGIIKGMGFNAIAFPGGHIVVTEKLAACVGSENELALVIGHELGHFGHRHHIKRAGRMAAFGIISALLIGDSSATKLVSKSVDVASLKYSRSQESESDIYGLDILNKAYGHVGGAMEFFPRLKAAEGDRTEWSSTHPVSDTRLKDIRLHIEKSGYDQRPVIAYKGNTCQEY